METKILTSGTIQNGTVAVLNTATKIHRTKVTDTGANKIVDILFTDKTTIHEAFFGLAKMMRQDPIIVSINRYTDLKDLAANCFCVTVWDGQNHFQIDILDYSTLDSGRCATFFLTEESFALLS